MSARSLLALLSVLIGITPQISTAGDITAGRELYLDFCAACHGAKLEGAPDWQTPGPDGRLPAPPHDETGHTWHHGDRFLFDYVKKGGQAVLDDLGVRYNSGMPPFDDVLSDAEIEAILSYITSTWPQRIRDFQAARTAQEQAGQAR
ncbi:MAG: cytochrome c [Rhodobacteraceae bacterium]|nr:cytochrome c [Paracoccaceae bacterium]